MAVIINNKFMLSVHSPKGMVSTSKAELLNNKMSPSFRHKRFPSSQDNYDNQSNKIKTLKLQSPTHRLEDPNRRQSQGRQTNSNKSFNMKKTKQKVPCNVIDSINCLKEEYKVLKQSYKEMIEQKVKINKQMIKIKSQNERLKNEHDNMMKENERMRRQLSFFQHENQRIKKESFKLIQVQKYKANKLQESLLQKEEYINHALYKIRTQRDECDLSHHIYNKTNFYKYNREYEEESLTISQDKSILDKDKGMNNQSQFLSFSLTSVLEESTCQQIKMNKNHVKHASELQTQRQLIDQIKITEVKSTRNKDLNINLKKFKKQMTNQRTMISFEKKQNKNKCKSYRQKQEDKEKEKENISQLKNCKKKSRKIINLSNQ